MRRSTRKFPSHLYGSLLPKIGHPSLLHLNCIGRHRRLYAAIRDGSYDFSEPFGPYIEACTSFYEFSGTKKVADKHTAMLNPYPIAPAIIPFPLLHAPVPAPAASTHYWLTTRTAFWSEPPSVAVAGTGCILKRLQN